MHNRPNFRIVDAILGLLLSSVAGVAGATSVERFTPQGEVAQVRQAVARFTAPMVNFGDPAAAAPFDVTCVAPGSGRWTNQSEWVYDFRSNLGYDASCSFTLRAGARDLSGKALVGQRVFAFRTGAAPPTRPYVSQTFPQRGETVVEDQVFVFVPATPVKEQSVQAHVYCSVEGIGERIALKFVADTARKSLMAKHSINAWQKPLVFQCQRRLPPGKSMSVVWGAGVESEAGAVTDESIRMDFRVRPEFTASINCERENASAGCVPLLSIHINFAWPAKRDHAVGMRLRDETGKLWEPDVPSGEEEEGDSSADANHINGIFFRGPFAENRKFSLVLPSQLNDRDSRPLSNRERLDAAVIRTGDYPPLVKFAAEFGIVEHNAGGLLPVTLRNLEPPGKDAAKQPGTGATMRILHLTKDEDIVAWISRTAKFGYEVRGDARGKSLLSGVPEARLSPLPKPNGPKAFEVVGIPLKQPGFHVVEVESERLGALVREGSGPMFVRATALATNLGVHFKKGRESSLVWVTRLDNARPVARARVAVRDCNGSLLWEGITGQDGTAAIELALQQPGRCDHVHGLFVSARAGDDVSFMLTSWGRGIENWRFNLPWSPNPEGSVFHAVLDRTLLRVGETLHMKFFARHQTSSGFAIPAAGQLPLFTEIVHQGSGQKFTLNLSWDGKGIAEAEWKIPPDAKLGTYHLLGGRFQVGEFRLPVFKGEVTPPSAPQVAVSEMEVDLHLSWLSGGAAGGEVVRLRSQIQPRALNFPDYEEFTLANGNAFVPAGDGSADSSNDYSGVESRLIGDRSGIVLSRAGAARVKVSDIPVVQQPAEVLHEMEFSDPSGEVHTLAARVPLWPTAVLAGIKVVGWAAQKERVDAIALVLGTDGKPRRGVEVSVSGWLSQTHSHRRRMAGGFYGYENKTDTKALGTLCSGLTDAKGMLACSTAVPASGELVLQALARDDAQRASHASTSVWVVGGDELWFGQQDNDRIDVLPEKKHYQPGQTARIQVRMPFREATALVTVEREGVLDTYVRQLSGKSPTIEIPVKPNYAPNAFISVLVVRGRVEDVKPTALVDLGKPAFKFGMGEIRVGWRANELKVAVRADRPVYQTRATAMVKISVRDGDGKIPAAGAEIVVAAVDEALLELAPNRTWRLLEYMMGRRALAVDTSTAQGQVVGKRHFGKKALPSGGGGGRLPTRELFDTLIKWQGRIVLDAKGEAQVAVPLNDALTTFRIVAVASSGAGRFGTGQTTIRSTRDLQIIPGLPPLVREGDMFRAAFTLRNTSKRLMKVSVTAKLARMTAQGPGAIPALERRDSELAPGAAQQISWQVAVPEATERLDWDVSVVELGGNEAGSAPGNTVRAQDRLRVTQKVVAAVPVTVRQATLLRVEGRGALPVAIPPDAVPGKGGLTIDYRARLGDSGEGIRRYMRDYPFICLEQKLSKSLALRDPVLWAGVVAVLPTYLDANGLAKYFPLGREGYVSLTAYILSAASEAGFPLPEDTRNRMESGLIAFVDGRLQEPVRWAPRGDLTERKLMALDALSRRNKVTERMLDSIELRPNSWPTSALVDWLGVLMRTPSLPKRAERIKEAEQILRARMTVAGTQLTFSSEQNDHLWWLMSSPNDNAARALLLLMNEAAWKDDIPRMVLGTVRRQKQGHWGTTTANVWGSLMLVKFAARFENTPVAGRTDALLGETRQSHEWNSGDGRVQFAWPKAPDSLRFSHHGSGKPWATVMSLAAVPLKAPFASGYWVSRSVTPVEQKVKGEWHRGDIMRVRLDIEAQTGMTWVVVSDPVPAGATILGSGLARESAITGASQSRAGGIARPAYEERAFEAFRAYYEYVPKGKWSIEYTLRLNNEGEFLLPQTRVEAMYAPENFGETPNQKVVVKP